MNVIFFERQTDYDEYVNAWFGGVIIYHDSKLKRVVISNPLNDDWRNALDRIKGAYILQSPTIEEWHSGMCRTNPFDK